MNDTEKNKEKNSWPWHETSDPFPTTGPDSSPWPKVTIVTPSYNQGQFLEETILSVLHQNYPNLEYIIMDGGSKDESVDIIKKYANKISHWQSEKDTGQSNAINKGWKMATGQIIGFLNSDDMLVKNALHHIVEAFVKNPGTGLVYGDAEVIGGEHKNIFARKSSPLEPFNLLKNGNPIRQPTAFIAKEVINKIGLLNEDLHTIMDMDLWTRIMLAGYKYIYLKGVNIAIMRWHENMKSDVMERRKMEEAGTHLKEYYEKLKTSNLIPAGEQKKYLDTFNSRMAFILYKIAVVDFLEGDRKMALKRLQKAVITSPSTMLFDKRIPRRLLIGWAIKWNKPQ